LVTTIDQVTFNQLDSRLLGYLNKKADLTDGTTISTTHQQIADDLHVSREAISRLLKTMEKRGMISLGRNRIEIQQLGQAT
jgi:CRP/FNR family transcriptional regulator